MNETNETVIQGKRIRRAEILLMLVFAAAILIPQLIGTPEKAASSQGGGQWKTLEDLKGKTFVAVTGSDYIRVIQKEYPDSPIIYVDDWAAEDLHVVQGKADALVSEESSAKVIMETYPELCILPEELDTLRCCWAVNRSSFGKTLVGELDTYFNMLKENGTMAEIFQLWKNADTAPDHVDPLPESGQARGTIHAVSSLDWMPMVYEKNGNPCGIFIDLLYRFCAWAGYELEIDYVNVGTLEAGFNAGKYDLMAYGMTYREEALDRMYFTEPIYEEPVYIMIHKDNYAYTQTGREENPENPVSGAEAFFTNLKASFTRTFLTENRWKSILSGMGVTVALSALTAVFGTLLGILICALRISRRPFLTAFARIYIKAVQGVPILVLLLILYYIVFVRTPLTAFWVSVIGFSVDFSAYASETFRSGLEAVPPGQERAARALGFSRAKAFLQVVIPQAVIHILPVYIGQLVSMVKQTSVAGYISVTDLTRVSDIIRSRTYEAFFPLFLTAAIYFVLAWLLTSALKLLERRIDPLYRRRTIRGVKMHADPN